MPNLAAIQCNLVLLPLKSASSKARRGLLVALLCKTDMDRRYVRV